MAPRSKRASWRHYLAYMLCQLSKQLAPYAMQCVCPKHSARRLPVMGCEEISAGQCPRETFPPDAVAVSIHGETIFSGMNKTQAPFVNALHVQFGRNCARESCNQISVNEVTFDVILNYLHTFTLSNNIIFVVYNIILFQTWKTVSCDNLYFCPCDRYSWHNAYPK